MVSAVPRRSGGSLDLPCGLAEIDENVIETREVGQCRDDHGGG
jgi:hypothetical protein